jgi:hypothetical protein
MIETILCALFIWFVLAALLAFLVAKFLGCIKEDI